jgi:hypothetical protein
MHKKGQWWVLKALALAIEHLVACDQVPALYLDVGSGSDQHSLLDRHLVPVGQMVGPRLVQ